MKTSILVRNGVSPEVVELIARLIALIPWPARRQSMGDVTLTILDGKPRVAEKEFGWNRSRRLSENSVKHTKSNSHIDQ